MRILYLAADPAGAPKGASVRIARTLDTLRALGAEVDAFLLPPPEEGSSAVPNYLDRMLEFREGAARWLDGRRADLVQFRGPWEGIPALAFARRTGARAVFEMHGIPSIELPSHYPALSRHPELLSKLVADERALVDGADAFVTPSRTGALFLERLGARPERISVVPNAVDPELFLPPAEPPPDAPPWRLFYQGTLAPWQGLDLLLEALVPFRHQSSLELHVVGPARSAWRTRVRTLARRLRVTPLVRLSRAVPQADLVPILHTSHVAVAPFPADPRNVLQGCCPLKLLEYAAAGRPILSTAIAPVEEILEDGRTARLVRPGSPHALAEGIAWMLSHPVERETLGREARSGVVRRYSPERFRERLGEAITSALGAPQGAPAPLPDPSPAC